MEYHGIAHVAFWTDSSLYPMLLLFYIM